MSRYTRQMPSNLALLLALTMNAVAIDGDTFDSGGVRYRLAGVDAPEMHGRCPAERALARLAKVRLEEILAQASKLDVEEVSRQPETTRFRARIVAHVRADGADVGSTLVSEGLARQAPSRGAWCETIAGN